MKLIKVFVIYVILDILLQKDHVVKMQIYIRDMWIFFQEIKIVIPHHLIVKNLIKIHKNVYIVNKILL